MLSDFDSINIGDSESLIKEITEEDVRRFVEMSGDNNPLHVDRVYAETTPFKDIVVHGMLGASFISTVIGTKIPGTGALWLSQNMEFLLPVRLGDRLVIKCSVLEKHDRDRLLVLSTTITNQNQHTVLSGTGKVKVLSPKPLKTDIIVTEDPVAIVTGGSGGIGRAISLALAKNGYNVVVNYRSNKYQAERLVSLINGLGAAKAIAVQADISTLKGSRLLCEQTLKTFGSISLLVNNASPAINSKSFDNSSWDDMQSQIDVQVKGAFHMCKFVVPHMTELGKGCIINITSQVVDSQPTSGWTGYAMAKGALKIFSNYMAAELGVKGIRVNCVAPGMCETPLIGDISEKVQLMTARQTPLRRIADPQDIADSVVYLASDSASFVTGVSLPVNGGIAIR